MKTKSQEFAEFIAQKSERVAAIYAAHPDFNLSAEELTEVKALDAEIDALEGDRKGALEIEAMAAKNKARLELVNKKPANPLPFPVKTSDGTDPSPRYEPAQAVYRYSRLKNFQGEHAHETAYGFGQWLRAIKGIPEAQVWCKDRGIELKASSETSNVAAGFLVPDEFDAALIDLREQFGVFRRNTRMVQMGGDTKIVPRRTGGLTAYFIGDNTAITDSDKNWDSVTLVAKKLGVLVLYSSELAEDSIISISDDLAGEIAYAFASKEDDCGFNGTGASTYGGITGATTALINLSATRANIAGLVLGAGNQWSELVLSDFNKVVGKLPLYADTPRARWFCHKTFWAEVMERLAVAAGGVTAAEVAGGISNRRRFLGYDVEITQQMPKVEANDQVCALLGDVSLGSRMGDRRMTTLAISTEYAFNKDQLALRGTERFDIVWHDVGNASATASLRQPGPVVGLLTAAS